MLLIGTCRLKLAASRSPKVRRLTRAIEGHVHYPEEIQQALRYISGETDIPQALLPLIHVDICDAKLDSMDAVNRWRQESGQLLSEARTVILEVSSYKRLPIEFEGETWYANLNAFATSVKHRKTKSSLFRPEVADLFADCRAELCLGERFATQLGHLLDQFGDRRLVLVPHFQAIRTDTGKPIENRPQLRDQLRAIAEARGIEFFDQDLIGALCGSERTRIDSSHYGELGEQIMATCLIEIERGTIDESRMKEHLREVASRLDRMPTDEALEPWLS